jgi:AsmA protein
MKNLLKIVFGLLGFIVLLLVLAIVLLPMIYDTDDMKQAISRGISEQTGRELSIDGELEFAVFPYLAVEVSDLALSNAEGFGDTPFAAANQMKVAVALLPLIRKELVAGEVLLSGMQVNLAVDRQGRNNWDDLVDAEDGSPATSVQDGSPFANQKIAGLIIQDALIEFRDEQAGAHYRLGDFDMKTGALGETGPVPVEISMLLEDLVAKTSMGVDLSSNATADMGQKIISLDDLVADVTVQAGGISKNVKVKAPLLQADLTAETLAVNSFSASAPGIEASGAVAGTSDRLELKNFSMQMDDSQFTGEMSIHNFDAPKISFDLAVDSIDLDRYMAPAEGDAGGDDEDVAIPGEDLKGLDVDGTLRAGALTMSGFDLSNAELGVRIKNSKLRLHPFSADFYGGHYSGDVRIDASGTTPVISADEKIESVVFQQLAGDVFGQDKLSGKAQGGLKVTGTGNTLNEVLANLNGDLGLRLDEGALEGIDVWYEIRNALALYKGKPGPETDLGRTVFSRLELDATIADGILNANELAGELPFLSLSGNGTIDLEKMVVDLGLLAAVRNVPELSQDPLGSDLKGKQVPFRISGAADNPKIGVDVEGLLKSEITNQLLDKVLGSSDSKEDSDGDGKDAASSLIGGLLGGSSSKDKKKKKKKDDDGE